MLLLKLESELPNLVKNFQSALKIWIRCRLNFHEGECTWGNITIPCQFSLDNSETVKAVSLAFSINQEHIIRDIRAKSAILNLRQSPDIR